MRMFKMLGLVLIAVSAIGAMTSASAGALSFNTTNAEEEVTGVALGKFTLESLGQTALVECPEAHIRGLVLNGTDLIDKLLFDFLNCKETAFNSSCNSSGGAAGLVLTLDLRGLLVWLLLTSGARDPGIYILSETSNDHDATFSCDSGLVTFKVTGGVLGEYTGKLHESTSSFNFAFRDKSGEKGMQQFTQYSTSESGGTLSSAHLTTEAIGLLKFTAESSEIWEAAIKMTNAGEINAVSLEWKGKVKVPLFQVSKANGFKEDVVNGGPGEAKKLKIKYMGEFEDNASPCEGANLAAGGECEVRIKCKATAKVGDKGEVTVEGENFAALKAKLECIA